jgi:hypothetical protein
MTIGCSPTSAAPAARPVNPVSAIGVDDAPRSELLQEILRHLEGATELADVFADEEDVGIGLHFGHHGRADGFEIGNSA